ncbi:MAG: hypothetical protein L3J62_07235 [Gammaproteobacteria bacterium]|nr:hypothetical protein [Gammaproteobacteria bacterium]MCF6230569.1 hypothetical protein [Gammaproteobacteria bacterium]
MLFSEWVAIAVNLLIAIYLIYFYPKTQAKIFQGIETPQAFVLLRTGAKVVGYLIILASLGYSLYRSFPP